MTFGMEVLLIASFIVYYNDNDRKAAFWVGVGLSSISLLFFSQSFAKDINISENINLEFVCELEKKIIFAFGQVAVIDNLLKGAALNSVQLTEVKLSH